MKKLKQKIILAILALTILNPSLAMAQGITGSNVTTYQGVEGSLTEYLCTPDANSDGRALEQCVNKLYRFGIAFGAIALVFFLVFAGYMYITAGETGKGKAKGILQNGLVGMGILLFSYALLRFINPNLVIYRPIQPPIFSSADLPPCEDVGLGENCVVEGGGTSTGTGDGTWGERLTCPANKLVSAKGLGLPTKSGDEKICEDFGKKLLGLKTQLSGLSWRITDTIGPGHLSKCHEAGDPQAGSCADIGYEPKDRSTTNWNKLCKALISIGQLQPVNEADSAATDCPKYGTYSTTTGNHIHVNWKSGGGGGGGSTAGGSRPNCISNSEFKFLCNSPGADPYDSKVITSTDSAIQANLTEVKNRLQKAGININNSSVRQVYRPHEYGAHLRSYWEAYALIQGKSDDFVKSTGYYCDGSIQYVKKSDIDALTPAQKNKISSHATGTHKMSLTFNTTCLSDHGFGYGVDYGSGSLTETTRLEAEGLCHNLNGGKWNQDRDNGHYVLKEKNRNNQGCR